MSLNDAFDSGATCTATWSSTSDAAATAELFLIAGDWITPPAPLWPQPRASHGTAVQGKPLALTGRHSKL